jgi:cell wall-associated NlpC family hydrolase
MTPSDAARRLVIRAAIAPLQAEPRVSSTQTSQYLAGAIVDVLARQGDWFNVRGRDGYRGWTHRGYLTALGDGDEVRWRGAAVSLGCAVRDATGAARAFPLGARVARDLAVIDGEVVTEQERERRFPPTPTEMARSAATLFSGAPYQWGGVTPWGADCSGFVQSVCRLHGIPLPRDAWQQAEAIAAVAIDPTQTEAGDLIFFSDRTDRRITHIGVALGERRMVHCALGRGGVATERLDDTADVYVAALLQRAVHVGRFGQR